MTAQDNADDAGDALLEIDHSVHKAMKRKRSHGAVKVLGRISDVGDQPQLRLLCGGVIFVGLLRRDVRLLSAGARMLLAHETATAAKSAIKHRVDRKRPRSADGKHEEKPRPGNDRGKEESSFPSGHSAGAMAVATAFSAIYPERRWPALGAAGAVAAAQIPRCAHYPTDVGAGMALGAAANGVVGMGLRILGLGLARLVRRTH